MTQYGAVSEPVAKAMAEGVRNRLGTDVAVSTTGYAGPTGGTDENPVGTVFVAVAHAGGTTVTRYGWVGTRAEVMNRTAKLALNALRLHLMKL
jgi:nicotinamide-nucleotide amidase